MNQRFHRHLFLFIVLCGSFSAFSQSKRALGNQRFELTDTFVLSAKLTPDLNCDSCSIVIDSTVVRKDEYFYAFHLLETFRGDSDVTAYYLRLTGTVSTMTYYSAEIWVAKVGTPSEIIFLHGKASVTRRRKR